MSKQWRSQNDEQALAACSPPFPSSLVIRISSFRSCHRIVTLIPLPPPTVFRIVDIVETVAPRMSILAENRAARRRRLTSEAAIKTFFGSNALVAIVVLALITIFLFREGFGFFGQNLANLRLYRRAGLEYVDIMRGQAQAHSALVRALNDVRVRGGGGTTVELDRFAVQFSDAGEFLNALVSDAGDQALALREAIAMREGRGGDINRGENEEAPAAASSLNEEQSLAALQANT